MTPARRHLLLLSLLAASAGAVAWDRLRDKPGAVSQPVARAATKPAPAPSPSAGTAPGAMPTIASLRGRDDYLTDGADAFPALNPPPPPAPPVAAAPVEAPRPTAPALPFTVIGKKLEAGVWEVFLVKGDLTYVARPGVVVGDDYRVEAIGPTQMTLIYLPLNETQILQTGATLQ